MSEWQSMAKLPDEGEDVLVFHPDGFYGVVQARLKDGVWVNSWDHEELAKQPIYWFAPPEPPEEQTILDAG